MIGFVETISRARDMEKVWEHHQHEMARFGFNRLLYGFTTQRTATSLGDPQDWLVLTNHDPNYIGPFIESGMYFNAPMVRWALENEGACSWGWMASQADAGRMSQAERRVYAFNKQNGIESGYTISFSGTSTRTKGGIALTAESGVPQSEVDAIWAEHGREIVAMNTVVHLKLISMPYTGARRKLTPRQREALEWVGDGKTMQDIAVIMGLTPATIEKHLRLARESLGVDTTAQAVLKAAFQNQIFVVEE
ncbi:MAG: LuxR family transcriptional regulator [Pseudomonadota bacterium]